MYNQLVSFFYKKYSLKPIQLYCLFQIFLIVLICLLKIWKFEVNGKLVSLSISDMLSILSFFSIGYGVLNANIELQTNSYKQCFLNRGGA